MDVTASVKKANSPSSVSMKLEILTRKFPIVNQELSSFVRKGLVRKCSIGCGHGA